MSRIRRILMGLLVALPLLAVTPMLTQAEAGDRGHHHSHGNRSQYYPQQRHYGHFHNHFGFHSRHPGYYYGRPRYYYQYGSPWYGHYRSYRRGGAGHGGPLSRFW